MCGLHIILTNPNIPKSSSYTFSGGVKGPPKGRAASGGVWGSCPNTDPHVRYDWKTRVSSETVKPFNKPKKNTQSHHVTLFSRTPDLENPYSEIVFF